MSDDRSSTSEPRDASGVPEVIVQPQSRRGRFIWLVPVLAVAVTVWVSVDAWFGRGPQIEIEFLDAHGLEAGDPVRCHGVEVGRVEEVVFDWNDGLGRVRVIAELKVDAGELLRAGTRFWIQRPELDFGGIRGLDTVVGPRYLALVPGAGELDGGPFLGLNRAPVLTEASFGDLEIIIASSERAGMRRGGLVSYRGMAAGRILEVELASDSTRVESTVLIKERYAPLVRSGTRFFSTSGVAFEFGFEGFRTDVDSLESIISGGIGFATPPDAGAAAVTGTRFDLAMKVDPDWLEWSPAIALGDLAGGSPASVRSTLRWKSGLLRLSRSRKGWITLMPNGVPVLPTALVTAPADAIDPTLEFGGISRGVESITTEATSWSSEIRVLQLDDLPSNLGFETGELAVSTLESRLDARSTILIHSGADLGPIPVPSGLWWHGNGGIVIDPGVGFADDMVGSPVTDAGTGFLVGLLVLDAGEARVVLIDPPRETES
jgi:paraquat-inducible protein B